MKRQSAPVTWRINRKGTKFIVKPNPGKPYKLSMPLSLIFKTLLKYCKTTKEVKNILQDKEVIVDGTRRKDHRFPVGFMDVISLPVSKENYRVLLNKRGKLVLVKIDEAEAGIKPCKIINKKKLKKAVLQLHFSDGRTMLLTKKQEYKVGDVLLLKIPSQEIQDHFKIEQGSHVFLTGGKYVGHQGKIGKIDNNIIQIKNPEGEQILTDKRYAFVIGNEKAIIKLPE